MLLPAYINVNTAGIPAISSNSIEVTDSEVKYTFNRHSAAGRPFRGLIAVRINQAIPEGTTETLPIVFAVDTNTANLTTKGGVNVTAADMSTGIYLIWYDSNTLQLIG